MRKRLLYDGHGTGEDKRIVTLSKSVAKLCLTENQDEFPKLLTSAQRDIALINASAERQIKIADRCDRTMLELDKAMQVHEQMVLEARAELAKLQLELEYVEQLKKISVHPDCVTTKRSIDDIENKKEKLMERLQKQRLHIKTVIESCRCLKKIFHDDET